MCYSSVCSQPHSNTPNRNSLILHLFHTLEFAPPLSLGKQSTFSLFAKHTGVHPCSSPFETRQGCWRCTPRVKIVDLVIPSAGFFVAGDEGGCLGMNVGGLASVGGRMPPSSVAKVTYLRVHRYCQNEQSAANFPGSTVGYPQRTGPGSLRTSVRRYAGTPTQTRTVAAIENTMKAIAPWPSKDNPSTIKAQIKSMPTILR